MSRVITRMSLEIRAAIVNDHHPFVLKRRDQCQTIFVRVDRPGNDLLSLAESEGRRNLPPINYLLSIGIG